MRKVDGSVFPSFLVVIIGLVLLGLINFAPNLVEGISEKGLIGIVITIIAAIYISVVIILRGLAHILE